MITTIVDVPVQEETFGNLIEAFSEACDIDPCSSIVNVAYVNKDPTMVTFDTYQNPMVLGIRGGIKTLTVYKRKFYFFKVKLLELLVNEDTGEYRVVSSAFPPGTSSSFSVSLRNLNRVPHPQIY